MKVFGVIFILLFAHFAFANPFHLGVMTGANTSLNQFDKNTFLQNHDSKLGYNANLFSRFQIAKLILQPEVGYLNNRVSLTLMQNNKSVDASISMGDIYGSILFGIKFSKLRIYLGPMAYSSTAYSIDNLLEEYNKIKSEDFTNVKFGAQAGVGVDLSKRWGIDFKYQKMLSSSKFTIVDIYNNNHEVVGNTGSLSVSLGFSIIKIQ